MLEIEMNEPHYDGPVRQYTVERLRSELALEWAVNGEATRIEYLPRPNRGGRPLPHEVKKNDILAWRTQREQSQRAYAAHPGISR